MNLPPCPNVREGRCTDSRLRLLSEDERSWKFLCAGCNLLWMVSKPNTRGRAARELAADRIQKASQQEREAAQRTRYFDIGRRRIH